MKERYFARQVRPEWQESRLYLDDWPERLILWGNGDYNSHTTENFDLILERFDDMVLNYERGDVNDGEEGGSIEAAREVLRWWYMGNYEDAEEVTLWRLLFNEYIAAGYDFTPSILCKALGLLCGGFWDYAEIRGSCPGDWQGAFFDRSVWSSDYIRGGFAVEYFNEGSEWIISERPSAEDPEEIDPDLDIEGVCCYSTEWDDDALRRDLAACAGCDPADLVLFFWAGEWAGNIYRIEEGA